jgi:hypothetical protein
MEETPACTLLMRRDFYGIEDETIFVPLGKL